MDIFKKLNHDFLLFIAMNEVPIKPRRPIISRTRLDATPVYGNFFSVVDVGFPFATVSFPVASAL